MYGFNGTLDEHECGTREEMINLELRSASGSGGVGYPAPEPGFMIDLVGVMNS